jgi:hypothetical protein
MVGFTWIHPDQPAASAVLEAIPVSRQSSASSSFPVSGIRSPVPAKLLRSMHEVLLRHLRLFAAIDLLPFHKSFGSAAEQSKWTTFPHLSPEVIVFVLAHPHTDASIVRPANLP